MGNSLSLNDYQTTVLARSSITRLWRMSESASPLLSFGTLTQLVASGSGIAYGQPGLLSGDSNGAVENLDTTGNSSLMASSLGINAASFSLEFLMMLVGGDALQVFSLHGTGNTFTGIYGSGTFTLTHVESGHSVVFPMALSEIYQIDVTYDGATLRLYSNGASAGSVALAVTGTLSTLTFGGGGNPSCSWLLDEVSTYSSALPADQIRGNYIAASWPPLAMMTVTPFAREGCPVRGVQVDALDDAGNTIVSTGYRLGTAHLLTMPGIGNPGSVAAAGMSGSLAALYRLGDAVGSMTALDGSGNGNSGTVAGGVTFGEPGAIEGSADTAALFDGTGRISTSNPVTSQVTFSAWIRPTSYASVQSSIADLGAPNFFLDSTGLLSCFASSANHLSTFKAPLNTWTHVGLTYDGTTVILYGNGVPVFTLTATLFQAGEHLYFGGRGDFPGDVDHSFHGYLDEVAFFQAPLSPGQFLGLFNSSFGDQPPAAYRAAARDANGMWTEWSAPVQSFISQYQRGGAQGSIGSGAMDDLHISSPGIFFPDLAQGSSRMSIRRTLVSEGFLDEVRSVGWPKARAAFEVKLDSLDENDRMLLHRFFRALNGPQRPFFFDYVEPADGMRTTGVARRYLVRFRDASLADSLFGGSFTESQFTLVEHQDCPTGGDTYRPQFALPVSIAESTNPPNYIDTEFQFEPRAGLDQSPKWKLADTGIGIFVGNATYQDLVESGPLMAFYALDD